jgi:hypothetical protein
MTRRALGFFIAFLFVPFSVAKEKPPFPKMIVSAKYVLVTTYFGDNLADSRVPQADRQAVIDVQDTIRDWGRYTLVYERRGADLIILVRKAGLQRCNLGLASTAARTDRAHQWAL